MPKVTTTKVVGGFVLGAIALLVAALVLFGGAALFQSTRKAVVYFEGSVNGLSVGAPVAFRGVDIGSVTDIVLQVNAQTGTATIPVYIQIDPSKISWAGGQQLTPEARQEVIKRGLRAQLATQSMITGQLIV